MKIYNEVKAEQFLNKYLKININILTKNVTQALEFAKKYEYPLALKIISDQALHKSAINGVRFVKNDKETMQHYNELLKIAKKLKLKLDGILAQTYISGREIIIGAKRDKTFGPVILFGTGGLFAEALKDFSLRICPVNQNEIISMMQETKVYEAIKNDPNLKLIINALIKINKIMMKHPEIIELEINPLIINEKGAIVADARMLLE